jgi:sulfate transport system permease protein
MRDLARRAASVASRLGLRTLALGYLALLLLAPVGMVFWRAFETGLGPAWDGVTSPAALHAFEMTLLIAAIAVPANTIFGVLCALAIVRKRFRGKGVLNAVVDLPLALSPVVVGLALILVYARGGWFGDPLLDNGIQVVFALPGMVLATIFVSLPFVVREVVPVLREIGIEQEQAAATLGANSFQTFRRITLPAIRWGVAYGVVLTTARALGEFGAVSVVSGRIAGKTETATLHVQERFDAFEYVAAYSVSVVLALIAVATLLVMNLFKSPAYEEKKT